MSASAPELSTVFYPNVRAKVTIRCDENLHALGSLDAGGNLDPTSLSFLPPGPPAMFGGFFLTPKSASIELATPRQAGKFSAEFVLRDVPLDPRIIRAMKLEWYIGTVPANDWARGVTGMTAKQRSTAAMSPRTAAGTPDPKTYVLTGIADTIEATNDENGCTLSCEGRDPAGLLLDAKIKNPALIEGLDIRQPIDDVVFQVLKAGNLGVTLSRANVLANRDEWDNGVIPSPGFINGQGLNRVRLSADGQNPTMRPPGAEAGLSLWDLITQLCTLVGAIPRFNREVLEVRRSRSLFSQLQGPTPFAGAKPRELVPPLVAKPTTLPIRYFIYGRDLKSVKISRKFQGKVVPRIKVVSTDDTKVGLHKPILGVWPPEGTNADQQKLDNEEMLISRPGIKDQARLTQLARDIYEEIGAGSGEIGGAAVTGMLASLGGNNADPDVLRLKPTDAIFIGVDTRRLSSNAPLVNEINNAARRDDDAQIAEVARRLGGEQPEATEEQRKMATRLARVIVESARGNVQETLGFFRVGNVKFAWSMSSGITVNFDFSNYIFAKNAVNEQNAPKPATGGTSKKVTNAPTVPKIKAPVAPVGQVSAAQQAQADLIQRSLDENGIPYSVVIGPSGQFSITTSGPAGGQ